MRFSAKDCAYSDMPSFLKPIRNLLHRRPPADLMLSVLDRQEREFSKACQDIVAAWTTAAG